MDLTDLLTPQGVVAHLRAGNKNQALQELARATAELTGLEERAIFDALLERERLGTTGVGLGIAIPHAKMPELKRLYGLLARLDQPVDFDSIDEQPVDIIFVLLAPETAGADHLKALARISRLLRNQSIVEKLRGAESAEAIFALLAESESSQAA